MGKRKPIDEVKEMHPNVQHDYLFELDVFIEEEWELYRYVIGDDYLLREVTSRTFEPKEGGEYRISVEHLYDGEAPDEMNTRVNIIRLNDS